MAGFNFTAPEKCYILSMQMALCGIMKLRRDIICLSAIALCLIIGISWGQDWLGGGYVGSYHGDIGKYFTDPIFYSSPIVGQTYQSKAGYYPGPYGVFPYYGTLPTIPTSG